MPSSSVTNISPKVRGSMKRSCPPWVKVMTTWVCFAIASFVPAARRNWPDMPRWITRTSPPSSFTSRYLPRRSTPMNFFPTSAPVNCLRCRYRRMERIPETSTALTFLPTTSFSRSRRITSTSGSSGTLLLPCPDRRLSRRHPFPRRTRRRLLGLLLRAALAVPVRLSVEEHRREEPLRVVGPLVANLVARQTVEPLRRELLQPRLVVVAAGTGGRLRNALGEEAQHDVPRGFHPAVEVDGRDDRLHRVGEDRRLLAPARAVLALPEQQARTEGDVGRDECEHLRVHHRGPHLGELTLLVLRVVPVDVVGDDHAEHRVTEELEPLVRRVLGMLGAPGAVREGLPEHAALAEGPSES